jgi:hypothetical protein
MNRLPPGHEPPDDVDEQYRRASAQDPSRPGEAVRRAILAHAERLAAERTDDRAAAAGPRRSARSRGWGIALAGTLAAAAIAGLVIAPQLLGPRSEPAVEAPPAAAPAPRVAVTEARAPVAVSSPAPATPELQRPVRTPQVPQAAAQPPREESASVAETAARHTGREAYAIRPLAPASQAAAGAEQSQGVESPQVMNSTMGGITQGAAFRRAAAAGDLAELAALLPHQSNINARDAQGRTALMLATVNGQAAAVTALLAGGADPNAADALGRTPLAAARAAGASDIVATLERYGAHE